MKKSLIVLPSIDDVKEYLLKQKCPICHEEIEKSPYLSELFKDDLQTQWVANLVTHYRHNHITSWNKCWGYHGDLYRKNWFGNYDEEKRLVNERAKRQLIKKGHRILSENGVTVETFHKLKHTTSKTLFVAMKFLKSEKEQILEGDIQNNNSQT